jgi:hypothetical protein
MAAHRQSGWQFAGGALSACHGGADRLALFADQPDEVWVFAGGDWLLKDPHGPMVPREAARPGLWAGGGREF